MYPDLRAFVEALDRAGELRRVSAEVDPVLEVAEIADRASKSPAPGLPSASARKNDPRFHHLGGPALLLENVKDSDFPVAINVYGSYRRMEMALGCHEPAGPRTRAAHTPGGFDAIAATIAELVKPEPPRSLRDALAKARQFLPLLTISPKRRRGMGLCQQVVRAGDAVDLTRLPIIRCWPHDGDFAALGYPPHVNAAVPGLGQGDAWDARFRGRYITLAGIHTIHADDADSPRPASHNIGMYRVQLLGRNRMAMHWHMHHDGARHWRSWKARGQPMPVAIVLGGPSILPYAATAPLPPGLSELLLAGFLNKGGLPMCRARTVPLWIPADAEIVIEGYVSHEAGPIGYDPRSGEPLGPGAVFEGPFGDHTGFYSLPDRYPVLEVSAITHRRDPIYPTTVVGLPPQEDYYLGKATERIFLPLLRTILPDIEDYDLPMFGAFHNCAFLKIKKSYPLHARRVMHGVWGAGQMSWTKSIFVVDHDVDVHDVPAVLRAAAERCAPGRDIESVTGPLDILDHAAPYVGAGGKLGFDCTRRVLGEELRGSPFTAAFTGPPASDAAPARHPPAEADRAATEAFIRALPGVRAATLPADLGAGWLFVSVDKTAPGQQHDVAARVAQALQAAPARVSHVVLLGPDVDPARTDDALFHWMAHCDFARDTTAVRAADAAADAGDLIAQVFDATPKSPAESRPGRLPARDWPPILQMDAAVRARVAGRWPEFGLA